MNEDFAVLNNATIVTALEQNTKLLRGLLSQWEVAGVDALLSAIDISSLNEVNEIAATCATLNLGTSGLSHDSQVKAVTFLIDQVSSSKCRLAESCNELNQSRCKLQQAVRELRSAKGLNPEIENRKSQALSLNEHAQSMSIKATEYELTGSGFMELVRKTGLENHCTHDAVTTDARTLAEMERRLEQVEEELSAYHGLPPNMDKCRETVDEMEARAKMVEAEIQGALSSLVRRVQ